MILTRICEERLTFIGACLVIAVASKTGFKKRIFVNDGVRKQLKKDKSWVIGWEKDINEWASLSGHRNREKDLKVV